MHRLFLDANVLFSAAYREDAGVRQLWTLSDAILLTSLYALDEARRNLSRAKQRRELKDLAAAMETVDAGTLPPNLRGKLELPEKDWPIVAGALEARATHLITGDLQHFGPYFGREILGILVLPPGDYLRSVR